MDEYIRTSILAGAAILEERIRLLLQPRPRWVPARVWRAVLGRVLVIESQRPARPREGQIILPIPEDAWSCLTLREQGSLIALDDFVAGRFDLEELKRRLALAEREEVSDDRLAVGVMHGKLERIARYVAEGREDLALEFVRHNLLREPVRDE